MGGGPLKRISDKHRAEFDGRPAIRTIPDPEDRNAEVRATDEGLQEFARRLPCAVCRRPTIASEPCHVRTRRRFGDWVEADGAVQGNLWPGCDRHHREQHDRGIKTFEVLHGIDLERVGAVVGATYLAGHEPETLAGEVGPGRPYESVDVDTLCAGIDEF